MSRRVVLLSAAALLVALGAAAAFWAVRRARAPVNDELKLPLRGAGVTLDWARGGAPGSASDEPRDYVLESDRLRLVLANDGSGMERHQRFGALIDFGTVSAAQDELIELRTVLYVAGSQTPLRTVGIEATRAGELPVLAVEEASRDGRFELRTEYRLAEKRDFVELVSTVTNASSKRIAAVQIGDRGRWPGTTAFAPRLGYVHLATRADVPWLGRVGRKLSYGFVFTDRPAQVAFQFDVVGPAGEVALGQSADLAPGQSAGFRRDVVVVPGGLGKAAEIAWRRLGKPIGHARGVLKPPQSWATISARHPDGRTVLSVPAESDGSFDLPLPVGEYRFVLAAPGGEDEELGTVAEGGDLRLNLVPPRPGTLTYLITDEHEQHLAGRLVVRGVPPTKDPDLVPGSNESGSRNMLYSLTGSGSIELPAGRYDVLATHGPEYSMPRQELELNADLGATFRGVFTRTVDTSGWLSADFHLHASPSKDSNVPLNDRVLTLAAEGVELGVPTDHNHVTDYSEAIAIQRLDGKLATMSGVEITTLNWGHFNAYPYPKSVDVPPTHETSPLEIFAVVRARAPQAVLQVNHPRMPGVGYFNRGELNTKTGVAESPEFSFGFDALEVSNGFDLEDPKVFERNFRDWFELLNVGHRYTAVGNSDSHRVVFQWAGWPRTYVRVPDQDLSRVQPLEVARAVTGGHAVVSCGIFVLPTANGSAGPGDTVQGSRVSLAVSVGAPEWVDVSRVEVYANGAKVEERTRDVPMRKSVWNLNIDLELKVDTWIVVLARGDKFMNDALPGKWIKPFGFSNPILVDADSDGSFVTAGP
ncbi:MAG: hypothetical protein K0R38_1204 [Polyangiaceae bacterium]|nr:hypothetical protein [Polyangiaceae bacterium]